MAPSYHINTSHTANTCGLSLAAGASCTINLTFEPTEIGPHTQPSSNRQAPTSILTPLSLPKTSPLPPTFHLHLPPPVCFPKPYPHSFTPTIDKSPSNTRSPTASVANASDFVQQTLSQVPPLPSICPEFLLGGTCDKVLTVFINHYQHGGVCLVGATRSASHLTRQGIEENCQRVGNSGVELIQEALGPRIRQMP